ncbi:hypothetical protein BCR44DRAFT_1291597 [Catenaria anguillulae PL171]|uniref:Uncharacterized protein n=1 Tax=Catenaria anguillulae PL171 TaxID=765915 RepID=A0A1Y2H9S4_9FUNG|nr:hypothetical protein BCR44DRAFT_1291597 [Catenaria anguillulae PL171]
MPPPDDPQQMIPENHTGPVSPSSPLLTSYREVSREVQLHFDLANDRRQFAAGPGSQLVRAGATTPPQPEPQQWSFSGLAGLLPLHFGHAPPTSAYHQQQQYAPSASLPPGFPQGMPQVTSNMFGTRQFPATMFPPQWGAWQGGMGPGPGSSGQM